MRDIIINIGIHKTKNNKYHENSTHIKMILNILLNIDRKY